MVETEEATEEAGERERRGQTGAEEGREKPRPRERVYAGEREKPTVVGNTGNRDMGVRGGTRRSPRQGS